MSYAVKGDDSFLKALVSEKQLKDTQYLDKLLEEYKMLEPFRTFFNIECEICHEPIKKWDDYSIKLAIDGTGRGHTHCWQSEIDQLRQLLKVIRKIRQDTK